MEILVTRRNRNYIMPGGQRKNLPALFPAYESQEPLLNKLPEKTIISIKTRVPRNLKRHNMIWAIINFTYDNLPETYIFPTIETFVEWLKITVGFVEVYSVNGICRTAGRSISFALCDETEFKMKFFDPALDVMADILGISTQELEDRSKEYDGLDYRYINMTGKSPAQEADGAI